VATGSGQLEADYGLFPGSHCGRNVEFASHGMGDRIDLIDSVICAKSIVYFVRGLRGVGAKEEVLFRMGVGDDFRAAGDSVWHG
jgi:hypothetical protein